MANVADPLGFVAGLATDYTVYDGLEPVAYQSTRNDGSMPDFYPSALRRALSTKEQAASGGAYQAGDVVWIVPATFVQPGMRLKPADVVIDSDQNRYTVLDASEQKKRQSWRLISRNLAIAFQLGDYVDIQKAGISYDRAGIEIQTYPEDGGGSVAYASLLCRVQEVSEVETDERLIRGFQGDFVIYLSQQINFTADFNRYRVKHTKAGLTRYYDIVGYRNAEQIAELPILEVRQKT
jgi:hypothetical protein